MKRFISILLILSMSLCSTFGFAESGIQLPANLKTISAEAFRGNSSIGIVDVPHGTASIDSKAFAKSGIWMIYIPSTVTQIASDAFDNTQVNICSPEGSYAQEYAEKYGFAWSDCGDHYREDQVDSVFDLLGKDPILQNLEIENLEYISTEGITDPQQLAEIVEINAMIDRVQPQIDEYNATIAEGDAVFGSLNQSIGDSAIVTDENSFSFSGGGLVFNMDSGLKNIGKVTQVELSEDGETLILYSNGKKFYGYVENGTINLSSVAPVTRSVHSRSNAEINLEESERLLSNFEATLHAIDIAFAASEEWVQKLIEKSAENIYFGKQQMEKYYRKYAPNSDMHVKAAEQLKNARVRLSSAAAFSKAVPLLNIPVQLAQMWNLAAQWKETNQIAAHKHPNEHNTSDEALKASRELNENLAKLYALYAIDAANGVLGIVTSMATYLSAAGTLVPPLSAIAAQFLVPGIAFSVASAVMGIPLTIFENKLLNTVKDIDRGLHTVVTGRVYDADNNRVIANVLISCPDAGTSEITDSNGDYEFYLEPGTHKLVFSCAGYQEQEITITLQKGENLQQNIKLNPAKVTVSGIIRDADTGEALPNVTVLAFDNMELSAPDGSYSIILPAEELNVITFMLEGYDDQVITLTLEDGLTVTRDILLRKTESDPPAASESDFTCKYLGINGTYGVEITKYLGEQTDVKIPATINGNPVISIGDKAFANHVLLERVIIPNTVISIGYYAFGRCTSLKKLNLPAQLAGFDTHAFAQCLSLTSITIPEGITSIPKYAFNECTSLARISLPSSIRTIDSMAFSYCSNLTSLRIPKDAVIKEGAFYMSRNLSRVYVSNSHAANYFAAHHPDVEIIYE